jgi:hypothetical protein
LQQLQQFLDTDVQIALFEVSTLSASLKVASAHFDRNGLEKPDNQKWFDCVVEDLSALPPLVVFYDKIVCFKLATELCKNTSYLFTNELTSLVSKLTQTTVQPDKQLFESLSRTLPSVCQQHQESVSNKASPCSNLMQNAVTLIKEVCGLIHIMRYSEEASDVTRQKMPIAFYEADSFLADLGANVIHYCSKKKVSRTWFQTITDPFISFFKRLESLVQQRPKTYTTLAIVALGAFGFYYGGMVAGALSGALLKGLYLALMAFFSLLETTLLGSTEVTLYNLFFLSGITARTVAPATSLASIGVCRFLTSTFTFQNWLISQAVLFMGLNLFWGVGPFTFVFFNLVVSYSKYPLRALKRNVVRTVVNKIPFMEEWDFYDY